MNRITSDCNMNVDLGVLAAAENKYNAAIRSDIKEFISKNAGGYPLKSVITAGGEEYEVRVFLSLDKNDEHYFIAEPLDEFMGRTKGRFIPFAIDSEDNYYCIDNDSGKLYYWSSEIDKYYFLSENLDAFCALFL